MNSDSKADAADYRARRQYSGDVALLYDRERQRTLYDRWKWRREHAAVDRALADLAPVETLLDVPTGTGRFLGQLASRFPGARTVGADISVDMLSVCRGRLSVQDNANATLIAAEAERLPFPDGTFDLVLSVRFFQHLPQGVIAPIITELVRVSRRGILIQAPLTQKYSSVVGRIFQRVHRVGVRRPSDRFFPTGLANFEALLAGLELRVHSSRPVTWWGGQLRLLHVAP